MAIDSPFHHQRGVTLLISLIMLTILTVFAAAMIRLSSTNMLIAGNMAVQRALTDSVQQVIETELNSANFYSDPVNQAPGSWWANNNQTYTLSSNEQAQYNGYAITVTRPHCLRAQPAAGYSALESQNSTTLEDTYWEVSATGTDTLTGATVTVTQGVKMTLGAGNCRV